MIDKCYYNFVQAAVCDRKGDNIHERENILVYVATDGSEDYFHSFFCLPSGKQISIQR